MSHKLVTVVGGSGFLGRYVVRELASKGYQVRVLCRDTIAAAHLKPSGNVGQVVIDYADVTRAETLDGKFDGSYAVVNLTGILYESGRQTFVAIHSNAAEYIAKLAKAARAERYVHLSALGVDHAQNSKYARTKMIGEKAVLAAFPAATILRPSVIFGPEDNFFNMFARMSVLAPALPAIGGGHTTFQPVYVGDVAKAVLTATETADCLGKTYELGGPQTYRFKELLQYMMEVTGKKRALIPMPSPIASIVAAFCELMPVPPLTRDQVRLLKTDNVVSEQALNFADLNITPRSIETVVPTYLSRLKKAA